MAHLWIKQTDAWSILGLGEESLALTDHGDCPVRRIGPEDDTGHAAVLCHGANPSPGGAWVLIAGDDTGVRINGRRLMVGIRLLRDRDEISAGGAARVFFSSEALAHIEPFPGAEQAIYCARCKQVIPEGASSVQCPQCRIWCHESEEYPCWTYAPTCPICDQPTALNAGYRWSPEEL